MHQGGPAPNDMDDYRTIIERFFFDNYNTIEEFLIYSRHKSSKYVVQIFFDSNFQNHIKMLQKAISPFSS